MVTGIFRPSGSDILQVAATKWLVVVTAPSTGGGAEEHLPRLVLRFPVHHAEWMRA